MSQRSAQKPVASRLARRAVSDPSVPRTSVQCPSSEHLPPSDEQPALIGQCPYCGRVNVVPQEPYNTYHLDGATVRARVGQHVRRYIPGSTSAACARCAESAIAQWLAQREAAALHG